MQGEKCEKDRKICAKAKREKDCNKKKAKVKRAQKAKRRTRCEKGHKKGVKTKSLCNKLRVRVIGGNARAFGIRLAGRVPKNSCKKDAKA